MVACRPSLAELIDAYPLKSIREDTTVAVFGVAMEACYDTGLGTLKHSTEAFHLEHSVGSRPVGARGVLAASPARQVPLARHPGARPSHLQHETVACGFLYLRRLRLSDAVRCARGSLCRRTRALCARRAHLLYGLCHRAQRRIQFDQRRRRALSRLHRAGPQRQTNCHHHRLRHADLFPGRECAARGLAFDERRNVRIRAACQCLAGTGRRRLIAGGGVRVSVAGLHAPRPLKFRKFVIPVPKPRVAFAQIGISCVDMLCATSVLYVLLPREAALGFFAFAGVYLLALAAGAISNVPGGIGVFEFVLLLLMPSVPEDRLLGALIAYRAIYYFTPFAIALVLLGAHEVWIHRAPVVRFARVARAFLTAVTPQAIAIAVFLAGAVLLFSGATPALGNRLALLRDFVPLSVLELSHLLGSVVGVGLLIIAHGLYRRLHTAWWITIWLLCAGILVSLLKGFDFEEATILAIVVIMLASARSRFRRRASLIEQHFSGAWVAAFFLVLAMAAWLVLFAYRHLPYDNELWWQFAFQASAPRSLRASLLAVMIGAAYGLWRVLRPAPPRFSAPKAKDLERVASLIENGEDTTANLALLGDKNLLFNKDRTACIMFQTSGNSWVAMGDPIGPPE